MKRFLKMRLTRRRLRIISTVFSLLFVTATLALLGATLAGDKLYVSGTTATGLWRSCYGTACQQHTEILKFQKINLVRDFLFLLMICASSLLLVAMIALNIALCKGKWALMAFTGATCSLTSTVLSLIYATILNAVNKNAVDTDYGWSSNTMFAASGTSIFALIWTLLLFIFTRKPSKKKDIQKMNIGEDKNTETLTTQHAKYLTDYRKEFDVKNFSYVYDYENSDECLY